MVYLNWHWHGIISLFSPIGAQNHALHPAVKQVRNATTILITKFNRAKVCVLKTNCTNTVLETLNTQACADYARFLYSNTILPWQKQATIH